MAFQRRQFGLEADQAAEDGESGRFAGGVQVEGVADSPRYWWGRRYWERDRKAQSGSCAAGSSTRSVDTGQCLIEIADQVVGMLQPDRQSQQVLREVGSRAVGGGAGLVLNKALRAAEAGGSGEQPHPGRHGGRGRSPAAQLAGDDSPEPVEHTCGEFVLGVIGQSGIVHRVHGRMPLQVLGDSGRTLGMGAHP